MYRGRFAPSPTGPIHLGTARTALVAWLAARAAGGTLVLRVEDLDTPRVRPGALEAMLDDLRWIGLDWDEGPDVGGPFGPYLQSQRRERYDAAIERLRASGRVFACTCSRKEIESVASAPHGEEPIYPGTCRSGPSHPERPAAVRFRFEAKDARAFDDGVHGAIGAGLGAGDFVVRRADGVHSYQLAVVVDDLAMEITDVVRGDDLLSSTPRQLALIEALGGRAPRYAHVPLVLGPDGQRLAKRHGAVTVREQREQGVLPETLVGRLARTLGLLDRDEALAARELVSRFSLAKIAKGPVTMG
ncbi:MAG: tRNA glutamyl-Q(34) synthetase GluQRS [Sandaracinaceae bacterium]|nr:tRNA glutamyl-Q(34) synthetase GluQRS [Sandaracinaceae bacterium]